ncbi:tyrosine-type recombinase/integrase [Bacillus infantis]|uniref:tyrosine-type recombinase/integrase n=1 Tax=Bacillus infantis TaxID=324767 RepID=UPI003019D828
MEIKLSQKLHGNSVLSVVEQVEYKQFDLEIYENSFLTLKKKGYIAADTFNDRTWIMPCEIKANNFELIFDFEVFSELNLAVKAFIALRRISGVNAHKCYDELQILKKSILLSQGFKHIDKLKEMFLPLSGPRAYSVSNVLKNFIGFYICEEKNDILAICETIPFEKFGNRNLPNFHDVLIFNDIVNDFFQTKPIEATLKYMPIMIWWLTTNVLPMRPNELLLMKVDCLDQKNDGSTWLKVPRIKNEQDSPDKTIIYEPIQIDNKTYQLITFYKIKLVELDIEDEYLFPRDFYLLYRKKRKSQAFKRMTLYNFEYLLQEFYNEVVEKIYAERNLERVKPGDTRHFAIINMFLQGFNMLSIARMAGHDVIATQENYYSHAVHFSQSYVYLLAQKILERKVSEPMSYGFIGWRREAYDRGKIYDEHDTTNFLIVDFGYCKEAPHLFPNTCIEDCRMCDNYVFKPNLSEYEEGIKWLEDYSDLLNQRINEILLLMKEQCSSLDISRHPNSKEILKTNSMKLVQYMDHKAIIDSRLMEEQRYE